MTIRNRKVGTRTVRANTLIPNPLNWRQHPPDQRDALTGLLTEVGDVDVLKVVETPDGLMLIDGHLRSEIAGDADVEVVVLDLDEGEQRKVLAFFDELGGLAYPDYGIQEELLKMLDVQDDDLMSLLDDMQHRIPEALVSPIYPEHSEQDMWPEIRLRVSPGTKAIYDTTMSKAEGESEAEQFAWLLSQAAR